MWSCEQFQTLLGSLVFHVWIAFLKTCYDYVKKVLCFQSQIQETRQLGVILTLVTCPPR